jgi:hypothetical protein
MEIELPPHLVIETVDCVVCGTRGFRKAWATRANGDHYNGCTFCTGIEGNCPDDDPRGLGHLPWDKVDNADKWQAPTSGD